MSEQTPNNILKFPLSRAMRVRHAFNKAKDTLEDKGTKLLGMDMYEDEPKQPIEGALETHINNAILEGRNASMQAGIDEGKDAKILSMSEHRNKKGLPPVLGDATVDKMINSDPTKDD